MPFFCLLPGLTLIYDRIKHKVTFQVVTSTHTWTVDATFTWQQGSWHNLTVTFSPSAGISLVIDGLLLGGTTGVQTGPSVAKAPITQTVSSTKATAPSMGPPTTSGGQTTSSPNQNSGQTTPQLSTTVHQTTPVASLIAGQSLCLGCIPGSVATNGTNSTTTILVVSVLTVHVHLTDLQRAGITSELFVCKTNIAEYHANESRLRCSYASDMLRSPSSAPTITTSSSSSICLDLNPYEDLKHYESDQ